MARRTTFPLPSVSWQAMQTRRYICSGGIPAGAEDELGAAATAGAAVEVAGVGAAPVPGLAALVTGALGAVGGAAGQAFSARSNSIARSMGIRTLLLVAGSTQLYEESTLFPSKRSSSAFLARAICSRGRGAAGGVRWANAVVKKYVR